eukprot:CAMPEP_0202480218 /NCGR_PEP_ID=MMETSP1361-20130828/296_1 /ASSEMBLY_ACC=CAM_ASM_000849 /TAXON_ID=210615 /ORGANISM="Staurosira complex sp., Strain CCMP2646" /LENGTH=186 /DNA_ID=CAMNT_0049107637 /DNA_START=29 /DNA_END=589 /DNA_ORIENTATION=-
MKVSLAAVSTLACLSGTSAFAPATQPVCNHHSLRLEMTHSRRNVLSQIAVWTAIGTTTASSPSLALETYLTEPTEEFKENERKAMEFRRQQLEIKQKFTTVLTRLNSAECKTEQDIVDALKELRALVVSTGGLPGGLKKEDLIKQVRSKKAKGFWPTNAEIAYQSLLSEIGFQQSPNTEKDLGNPL